MLGPDGCLEGLHLFAGGQGDLRTAGHHPGHHAHAAGEDHGALRGALPQDAAEIPVRQGQHIGHGDDVGRMGMINHAGGAVRGGHADGVVHKVGGELTGGAAAVHQAPDDAVAVALIVDLHDADAVLGIEDHVAEEFAAAGGNEVFPGQVFSGNAHADPGAGLGVEEGLHGFHFLRLQPVGEVAAVALMPALEPAVVAGADVFLHDIQIENAHFFFSFLCACCEFGENRNSEAHRDSLLPSAVKRGRHPPAAANRRKLITG